MDLFPLFKLINPSLESCNLSKCVSLLFLAQLSTFSVSSYTLTFLAITSVISVEGAFAKQFGDLGTVEVSTIGSLV